MRIENVRFQTKNGRAELSASVRPDHLRAEKSRVWFRFPAAASPHHPGDVFLCAFLVSCMQAGEDLDVASPVSPRLHGAVTRIQDILLGWYPGFRRSRLTAPVGKEAVSTAMRTAACFSGGVDSLYTQMDPNLKTDRLVLVHGFENPVERIDLLQTTLQAVESQARMLKRQIMVVETNLRSLADRSFSRWGTRFPGNFFGTCWLSGFLAAIAHCLQAECNRFVIPASLSLAALNPYGSHPHLDALWSSDAVRIIHHGAEAGRIEKIRRITRNAPRAAEWLQVCESNPPDRINCGDCDKCLRTRLALRLAGIKEPNHAFSAPPHWARWPLVADRGRWGREYDELLRWCGPDREPAAASALETILSPPPWWRDLHRRARNLAKNVAWRYFPGLAGRLRNKRRREW
ncbi:MAG TPA: hypothetical protein ENN40_04440 [Candidatus Aminicenantes bacterium]|nr:hypothetical protein [Candidatus Aminicenantes bacterium]